MLTQLKQWGGVVGILLVFIVLGELLKEPLDPLTTFISAHEQPLLIMTGTVTAIGFVVFLGSLLFLLIKPQVTTSSGSAPPSTAPTVLRRTASGGRVIASGELEVDISYSAIKQALRTGEWWHDPRWRILFVIMAGAIVMGVGIVALGVILGPLSVKLLLMSVLAYAVVTIGLAFAQA